MINVNRVRLLLSAGNAKQFPSPYLPEAVLLGRSNVGKSSLINQLLNRTNFARTSSVPGKTATINFYELDEALMLVDLPGYGYAKVSQSEKQKWADLIESYLNALRPNRLMVQLVDLRHLPTTDDQGMMAWIKGHNLPYLVVATKADKLKKSELEQKKADVMQALDLPDESKLILFSAKTGEGRDRLLSRLTELIERR